MKQEKADLVTTPKTFPLATCPPGPPGPPPPTELEVSGKDSDLEIVGKDPDTLNSESNENLTPSPHMLPPLPSEAHAILAQQLQDALEAKTKLENDLHAERLKTAQLENKLSLGI